MENKEFSLKNYEDYKDYYEDATKEEIIADTYADYLAYGNTLQELSIANDKLKKIEELISTYPSVRIIEEQGIRFAIEVSSSELVDLLKTVLKIIKGDKEE